MAAGQATLIDYKRIHELTRVTDYRSTGPALATNSTGRALTKNFSRAPYLPAAGASHIVCNPPRESVAFSTQRSQSMLKKLLANWGG
jgi:hypothetical protein